VVVLVVLVEVVDGPILDHKMVEELMYQLAEVLVPILPVLDGEILDGKHLDMVVEVVVVQVVQQQQIHSGGEVRHHPQMVLD
jgi:hypothetical protein